MWGVFDPNPRKLRKVRGPAPKGKPAIPGDVRRDVDRYPGVGAERAGRAKRAAQGRRVVVSDAGLGPGVVTHALESIPCARGAIGVNA